MDSSRSPRLPELVELTLEQAQEHALILMQADGTILAWLMGAQRTFGYAAEEMVGRNFGVLFTPEDQRLDIPRTERETALEHGVGENDRWMVRKDGVRIFVTGGTGAIGRHALPALIGDGHQVVALARSRAKADAIRAHGLRNSLLIAVAPTATISTGKVASRTSSRLPAWKPTLVCATFADERKRLPMRLGAMFP